MKVCTKCKIEKELTEFNKNKDSKFGVRSTCKSCNKVYHKKYHEENKEQIKKRQKKWREENKEYLKQKRKKYFQKNKENINKNRKKKYKTDPVYKFNNVTRSLLSDSFKRACNGQYRKSEKTEKILGCDMNFFMRYIKSKFQKGMTFENHGEWHIDHIVPISSANTEEEIIALNHYTNLQPLWADENLSKSNKILEQQLVLL